MAAVDALREFLTTRGTFTDAELAFIETLMLPRTFRSGDFLQRAGDVSQYVAFIATGCLRSYSIDDRGNEHIVQFAAETYWLGDSASMTTGAPSQFFIQALEDSDLLLISKPAHERLMTEVPGYAEGFRVGVLRHSAAKDRRILAALSASAEERYLDFQKTYPSIVTRVPQWMLASYLGISPETLSRIRKSLSRPRRRQTRSKEASWRRESIAVTCRPRTRRGDSRRTHPRSSGRAARTSRESAGDRTSRHLLGIVGVSLRRP